MHQGTSMQQAQATNDTEFTRLKQTTQEKSRSSESTSQLGRYMTTRAYPQKCPPVWSLFHAD